MAAAVPKWSSSWTARGEPARWHAEGIEPEVAPRDEEETFDRTVDEGRQRLGRSWLQLIATGLLGGLDIGVGVLALLLVEHLTGDPLLSALAFAAGFIALTMARSELFTENFLVAWSW